MTVLLPLSRTIVLTDLGASGFTADLAAYDGTAVVTPAPTPAATLGALSLAASQLLENSPAGTVIGGIIGATAGSTLTVVTTNGNRFTTAGRNLVAGSVAADYETAISYQVTVRENLAGATNDGRETTFTVGIVNAFEQPDLRALSFGGAASLKVGTPASGAILDAAAGSTITATGLPAGFTINSAARTWSYDGTGNAGTANVVLTEILGDSANSGRQSPIRVAITAPAPTIAFDATSVTIAEGNSGTKTVTTTINLVRDGLTGARVINLAYGGTATAGSDYVAGPASVTVPAGLSSVSFDLTINGDTSVEADETIVMTGTLAGYGSVTASKTITIQNDDVPAPAGRPPAPEISQTSTAGSAPFAWRTVNNPAYSGGMYWHVQRATSLANLNAGTLNGEAVQMIQPQDLAADGGVVFADLTSTPTGNLALRERVGRDDGSGVIVWGDWSNVLQDVIAATFSGTLDPAHSYKDYTVSADKLSVRAAEYSFRAASRSTARLTGKAGYFEGMWTDASAAGDTGTIAISDTFDPSASTAPASPGSGSTPGKFVSKEGYSNGAEAFTFNGVRATGSAIGLILYENGATKRFWVVSAEGVYPDVPTFDANQNLTSGSGFAHTIAQPYAYLCPGGGEEMKINLGGSPFQHAAKIPANVPKGVA